MSIKLVKQTTINFSRLLIILLGCNFFMASCTSRAFYRPRSEIIQEAETKGIEVASAEEEREAFFSVEEDNRQRLMRIIEKRSQGEIRDENYRIGAQDEIEINVFDVPELNLTARVGQSGFLSLALVGAVKAAGLTETELKEELSKRLRDYVRDPQVSVFISAYGSQKVAVLGAVQKPGTVSLKKGSTSVLEVIGEAGGVNSRAGNFLSFIPSELSGISSQNSVEARARLALANDRGTAKESGIDIYLDQVLGTFGGIPLEIPVRGGDMIIIPEAGKVMVEGEVQKPGAIELGPQTTLLGALASVGGITYGAKVDEVEIIRDLGFEKKAHLIVNLQNLASGEENDVRLRNSDIVRVPSASGRRLAQDTFEGITKIINFGIGGTVSVVP